MKINADKMVQHIEDLYECGKQENGDHTRLAFTKEDQKGRALFASYFENLGLNTRQDAAGNLIVRMEGTQKDLPCIMIGSHLDTVPDGGRYDGVYGCVAGLAVCEALIKAEKTLCHPLEVVVFADEEGARFGNGMLGSTAMCHGEQDIKADDKDCFGQKRREVLSQAGIDFDKMAEAKRKEEDIFCFLELHVEQGSRLDKAQCPIGIVSSIAGVLRYEVAVSGVANHSGSTMMDERQDALVSAAEFIAAVPNLVNQEGEAYTVATVGTIAVKPGSVNVIPESAGFHLEIRDTEDAVMKKMEAVFLKKLDTICQANGTSFEMRQISYHAPVPMHSHIQAQIEAAAKKLDYPYLSIPSGAFHDSLLMAEIFKTGMIFVPSVGGISHSRHEETKRDDLEKGCNLLLETVLLLDKAGSK